VADETKVGRWIVIEIEMQPIGEHAAATFDTDDDMADEKAWSAFEDAVESRLKDIAAIHHIDFVRYPS
jgi:hypothetical protein